MFLLLRLILSYTNLSFESRLIPRRPLFFYFSENITIAVLTKAFELKKIIHNSMRSKHLFLRIDQ